MNSKHVEYMQLALGQAEKAGQKNEVPVGAVIVHKNGDILSRACNSSISLNDPAGHAEILALRIASQKVMNYRLLDTTLYVTIEPCIMCMGAIINARVSMVVFGANDPKWGAAGSLYNFSNDYRLNHRVKIISGICMEECRSIIQDFFRKKRYDAKSHLRICRSLGEP